MVVSDAAETIYGLRTNNNSRDDIHIDDLEDSGSDEIIY